MPRKRQSQAVVHKQGQFDGEAHGDLGATEIDDIPDEKTLIKLKEKMLKERPEFKHAFQYMEQISEERIKQAQDSYTVLANTRGFVTPDLLLHYPNSPTARYTMEALNHYAIAWDILRSYPKPRALLQTDCDYLQPGLHHLIEGYMMETYLLSQFPLPSSFNNLVKDYLQLRPNDILVEYTHGNLVVELEAAKLPDYERCKETIRALEMVVYKLLPYKHDATAKRILINAYYMLGARYSTTDQTLRAQEAFEKCYSLDETNISAIYGVASQYMDKDHKKSLKLCNKYLDRAPKCDEKFPNIHYVIGYIYALHFKDFNLAKRYYYLGKKAETFRLPFNPPTELPAKMLLATIVPIIESNKGMLQNALKHVDMKELMEKS